MTSEHKDPQRDRRETPPNGPEISAIDAISQLRESLSSASAEFRAAALAEQEAETLCAKIRSDLRGKRISLNIDQAVLAKRMNLTQSSISKLETGKGDIGLKTLYRFTNALGLRPVVLLVSAPTELIDRDDEELPSRQTLEEVNDIVSSQDAFLQRLSEMVPDLMARKLKSA